MKRIILFSLITLFYLNPLSAQDNEVKSPFQTGIFTFEPGLLIGNPYGNYPTPFSSHFSFLMAIKSNRILGGIGTGAEIIGKTFLPLFIDIRAIPLNKKPIFVYGKCGYSFCFNSDDAGGEINSDYYYSYLPRPHYPWQNNITQGGFLSECGLGILLKRNEWKTSLSLGFRHQQTKDLLTQQNGSEKIFENRFNRIVFRVGFWF